MMKGHQFIIIIFFSLLFNQNNNQNTIEYYPEDFERISSQWSNEAKTTFYLAERISPERAVFYQASSFLPFMNLGYAYSDNYGDGVLLDFFSIIALIITYHYNTIDYEDYNFSDELDYEDTVDQNEFMVDIGRAAYVGIQLYKYYDVYNKAEDYNSKLYDRLFNGARPSFSIKYSPQAQHAMISMNIPIRTH